MEKIYVQYQNNNDLGTRVSTLPITNGQIDFRKTHKKCRDFPCCIVFLIFAVVSLGLFVYSIVVGKPGLMYNPVDSLNGICGFDFQNVNNKGKPYLMTGIGTENDTFNLCVSRCPSGGNNCACSNGSEPFHAESESACLADETCCFYEGEDTQPVLDYCVPKSNADAANKGGSQIIRDVISRLWICGIALGITAGLCVVYVVLLIFFAYYIVWGTIFISLGGMFLLCAALFVLAGVLYARGDTSGASFVLTVMGAVFLLVVLVLGCVVFFMRARINLCISLIKETCRGLRALPALCVVPVVFTLLSAGAYVLYGVGQVFFMGTFAVTVEEGVRSFAPSTFHSIMYVLMFFVIMWVSFACIGYAQSVIAGGLAAWYFSDTRAHLHNTTPVASSFYRTFRYSGGTILFGSGIIALIETLKMLAKSGQKKANNGGGNNDSSAACMAAVCCCVQCVLQLIERIVVFISERAYIVTSITGNGFIESCKDSFRLLLRNIITTLVLENVKTLPIILGKVFIFIISAFATLIVCNPYIFSSSTSSYVVQYWWIVYILCIIVIFFVLQMMTTLITYGIDSIFIFYLVDSEYAKSSGGVPFASPDLSNHMDGEVFVKGRELASKYNLSVPADPPLPASSAPGYAPPSASAFAGYPLPPSDTGSYPPPPASGTDTGALRAAPTHSSSYSAMASAAREGQPPYAQPSYAYPSDTNTPYPPPTGEYSGPPPAIYQGQPSNGY